jgi:cellulose synthase/poly-beta-1,6-N-acetylglucosamine synthase-like glycosyltransferase
VGTCKKEVLVVYNSPDQHPNFAPVIKDWQQKYEAQGFKLTVRENKESTSKCDNLNLACEIITTEVCVLNDADTMLDWTCIVRGSEHIRNGYDIAQSTNTHCLYDRLGTPGDENERQCHPYGILITIGDSTKPQNMSTQTPFAHAPFNGRGGFWRTSALQQVGFDHRTVGEDHDAGYRGCAYFGFKGILDMNMLCQEQEPPDCKALTSQRIRWETAALEMRRTFSWILRSPHYGRFETFILLWGQMQQNCNMPFQSLAFQVVGCMPLIMMKSWLSIYALGAVNDVNMTLQKLCERDNCVISFEDVKSPISGELFNIALPLPIAIFAAMTIIFMIINGFDFIMRLLTTRYRPSLMFFVYYGVLKQMFVAPYFCYVQYWAMYDYCWGGAKFIATARSPLSPKSEQAALEKPLLPR